MLQPKKTTAPVDVDNIQEEKVWEPYLGSSAPQPSPGSRGVAYEHLETPDFIPPERPELPTWDPQQQQEAQPSLDQRLEQTANAPVTDVSGGGISRDASTLDFSKEDFFVAGDYDNTEAYAIGQSSVSKMVNGVGKGLVLTGTTFVQSTAGLVNGVAEFISTGRAASFYDNEFNQALDGINKWSENAMPNYYSHAEQDAHWYSGTKLFSANFLWDGIIKNMGFAAGAALSGGVFSAGIKGATALGIKALPKAAKLFSTGKAAEALAATETALNSAGKIGKAGDALGALTSLSDKHIRLYNVLNKAQRTVVAGLATTGEAGFEAMHGLNEYRDEAIAEYVDTYGYEPTGADLDEINGIADEVGNNIFALNAGLLSATNYIQFPKILGSSYKAEKGLIAGMKKDVADIVKVDGKFAIKETKNAALRNLKKVQKPLSYLFSTSEAFEEGAQFASGFGTKDYYDKKRAGDPYSILESALAAVKETFTTDEGMENILIGGLSGAIMLGRGKFREGTQRAANTAAAVTGFNQRDLSGFSKATVNSVIRGANIQEERAELLKKGDQQGVEDKEADFIINYLTPRIKYGRMDLVNEEINTYRQLASSEDGWNQLIAEGKAEVTDTREAYLERLDNLERTAESMHSLYQSISIRYGNMVDSSGNAVYPEDVIEKMMYAGSKIDDYNRRMADLAPMTVGVDVQQMVDDIVLTESPLNRRAIDEINNNDELTVQEKERLLGEVLPDPNWDAQASYNKAIAEIDQLDNLTPEQKTTAKEAVDNMAKMALYRDMYTKEYEAFKERPQEFKEKASATDSATPPTEEEKAAAASSGTTPVGKTFTIKTKKGSVEVSEGVEYYLGKIVSYSDKGNEHYRAAKFYVLGENEDGTIKIKDSNGIRDISKEEFESYDIGRVDTVEKNPKAKFYMENWNTVYTYNFGKKWGGKKLGRLEYSPKKDKLIFVYVDKKGKVHRKEVTNRDFVADKKRGFKDAKIQRKGEVKYQSPEALAAEQAFLKMKDEVTLSDKLERRLESLGQLMDNLVIRQEKTGKLITEKKATIERLRTEIGSLDASKIKRGTRGKGPATFKAKMNKLNATATRLTTMLRQLEQEVEAHEADLDELALTRAETQDLIDNIDDLPEMTKDFVVKLKEDQFQVELAHETTYKQLGVLKKLIASTQEVLDTVIETVGDMIASFEKKYPKVPRIMGQDWVDFLKENPNFLKLRGTYRAELEAIDDSIANIENEDIDPKVAKLKKLDGQLEKTYEELEEMEALIKAKQNVIDHFQEAYESYREEKRQKVKAAQNEKVTEELDGTLDTSPQNFHEDEGDMGKKEYQPESKKAKEIVRKSSVVPSWDNVGEYVERSQKFADQFFELAKKTKTKFKVQILNHTTYVQVAPDLMGELINKEGVDPTDILVMMVTNEKGQPVDQNGEVIPEGANVAELGIFQVLPAENLTQKYFNDETGRLETQTMFRDDVPAAEVKAMTAQYKEWRDSLKEEKELGKLRDFSPSFGIIETIKNEAGENDYKARTSVQDTGMISDAALSESPVIVIPTTNKSYTSGTVTFANALGRVLLQAKNGLVKLYNKKFSNAEAQSIYNGLHYVSTVALEEGTIKDEKANDIFNWLKTIVYYGKPLNERGNSSIYYEWVETVPGDPTSRERRIFFGKDTDFSFTPEEMKNNKQQIIAAIIKMHHNAQNKLLSTSSFNKNYYEITEVNEDGSFGQPRKWANYQTYLLSNKYPDGSKRSTDDIPLSTNMKESDPTDLNRKGMYFTLTETPEQFAEAKKPEPKAVKKVTQNVPTAGKSYVLDGKTQNSKKIFTYGDVSFTLDASALIKLMEDAGYSDLSSLMGNASAFSAFEKTIPSEVFDIQIAQEEETVPQRLAEAADLSIEEAENGIKVLILSQVKESIVSVAIKEDTEQEVDPSAPLIARAEGEVILDNTHKNIIELPGYGNIEVAANGEALKAVLKQSPTFADGENKAQLAAYMQGNGTLTIDGNPSVIKSIEATGKHGDTKAVELEVMLAAFDVILDTAKREIAQEKVAYEKEQEALKKDDGSPAEEVTPTEVDKEIVATEDPEADAPESDPELDDWLDGTDEGQDDSAFRAELLEQNEPFKSENWDKITPWLEKNFPNLPVYRVKNMIQSANGKQVWGMLQKGAIYVSDAAGEGTAYHEVFEAVWKMMADPKEKRAIIKEFRDRKGSYTDRFSGEEVKYSQATNAQLKEELAEEFKDQVLHGKQPKRKSKSLIKRIFQAIIDMTNTFFRGETGANNTKKLFDKIGRGYYKDYNQYQSQLSFANAGVINIENAIGDSDSEYRMKIPVIQQHELVQHMTAEIVRGLIKTNKGLFQVTKKLKDKTLYNELYRNIIGDSRNKTLGIIQRKAKGYAKLVAEGKMTREDATRKTDDLRELWGQVKLNWDEIVTKHKQQLRAYQIEFDENDNVIDNDIDNNGKGDYMDSNKLDSYKKANLAIKLLLATLPDTHIVNGVSKVVPSSIGGTTFMKSSRVFITLMNELHSSSNIEDMLDRLKAFALSNKGANYAGLYQRLTGQPVNDATNTVLNIADMQEHDLMLLTGFWKTFKKQNPDVLTVFILANGDISIGNTDLSSASKQAAYEMSNTIIETVRSGKSKLFEKKRDGYSATAKMKSVAIDSSKIKNYTDFLARLGINMDPVKVEDSLRSRPTQMKLFKTAVDGLRQSLSEVEDVVSLNARTMDTKGRLLEIGMIQSILENKDFESTYFSIGGERTQTFIGTNHTSTFFDHFSAATENFKELANTPLSYLANDSFSKGSVILNKVFNMKEDKQGRIDGTEDIMKTVYVDGSVDDTNGNKSQSSGLTYRQRLIQEINLNLDGVYMNLVPGDAELEWGLRLHSKSDPFVSSEDLKYNEHQRIFKEYFKAEVLLARDERIIASGKDRKATDLRFFKDILGKSLHSKVVRHMNSKKNPTSDQVYENFKNDITEAVNQFIAEDALKTENMLRENNLVSNSSKGLESQEISFDTKSSVESQIEQLSVNYMIANIEMHKLLYSDPYQYKDELKRIKNFNSPRVPLVHGSAAVNEAFDAIYNKNFKEGELGWTDMRRDHFRTVTLSDIWSVSDDADYKNPYEETDGGGVITMKSNRIFRIRTGDWTGAHENQYQHDIIYERLAKKSIAESSTQEEKVKALADLEAHEKNNPGIKDTYKPLKPIAAGNKANRREFNDILLDKYALFPMSYRLLHKLDPNSNMLKLNNKMVAEDIDYGVFQSGRKVGAEKVFEVYNEDGSFNQNTPFQEDWEIKEEEENLPNSNTPLGVTNVPFFILGLQTEVPSKDNSLVTRGSQITKLATMDYMEAGVPVDYMEGKDFNERFASWITLTENQKQDESPLYGEIIYNQKLLDTQTNENFINLLENLGLEDDGTGFKIVNRDKLIQNIETEVFKREINDNLIEAFQGFKNDDVIIEATPAYQQVRNILYSIASGNVIRPKVTGGLKVQVSSAMLESQRAKAVEINGKKTYVSNYLDFYSRQEDGKTVNVAEIMIGRWFKSDKTDKELLDSWYNTDEDGKKTLTEEGKKVLSGIGFRTPTQKQNSIDAFVIKGFLPAEYGDSIILPSEIVNKSGSDFDIDKFSIYLKNVFNDKGRITTIPFHGLGTGAKEIFRKQYKKDLKKRTDKALGKDPDLMKILQRVIFGSATPQERKIWDPALIDPILEYFTEGEVYTEEEIASYFVNERKVVSAKGLSNEEVQQILEDKYVEKMYKGSLQNEYLDSLYTLISHPKNYERLMKPNSAEQLKKLSATIHKALGRETVDYSSPGTMLSRSLMSGLRQAFVSGKQAIGIAAIGQTNHSQNQRAPIYIDSDLLNKIEMSNYDREFMGDGTVNFKEYNSIDIAGKRMPTLSMIKNAVGDDISDIIGMFIDGYVDISKGPWILEMGAGKKVAGTWLLLIKMGVPVDTVGYFMNQPIVLEYLRDLEAQGTKGMFSKPARDSILQRYQSESEIEITEIPSTESLKKMMGKGITRDGKNSLNEVQRAEQTYILEEFLKYGKMSQQLLQVTQGTNHDTATLNDPFLVFKKRMQLARAQETLFASMKVEDDGTQTEISAADALLESSFVGNLAKTVTKFRNAASTVLISDQGPVRDLMEKVLMPYIQNSDKDFVKIAQRAVESLFDWAVQTDQGYANTLSDVILGDDSYVKEILEFKEKVAKDTNHPLHGNMVLEGLALKPGEKDDSLSNLEIIGRDNKAVYDQNQIINSFKEIDDYLKNNDEVQEDRDIYTKLVRVALMQSGLTNSPISFTKLLPYADFKAQYDESLKKLKDMPNLDDFYKTRAFQRNNWAYESVVPTVRIPWRQKMDMSWFDPAMPPVLLRKARFAGAIPRTISVGSWERDAQMDVITYTYSNQVKRNPNLSAAEKRARIAKGDTRDIVKILMQKVYDSEGNAIEVKKGKGFGYIYKAINAWGDSFRTQEYYNYFGVQEPTVPAGVVDNGYLKVKRTWEKGKQIASNERADAEIERVLKGGSVVGATARAMSESTSLPMTDGNIQKIKNGVKSMTTRNEVFKEGQYTLKDGTRINLKPLGKASVEFIGDAAIVVTEDQTQSWNANDFARAEGYKDFQDFQDTTTMSKEFVNGRAAKYVYSITPVNPVTSPTTTQKAETTNIYFGKGDNKNLSNLAKRPFKYGNKEYASVEHAYQTLKSGNFNQSVYDRPADFVGKKVNAPGQVNVNLNVKLMGMLMKASFKDSRNVEALKELIATGSTKITHLGGGDAFWETKFPELLTEVRYQLATEYKDENWKKKDNDCNPI